MTKPDILSRLDTAIRNRLYSSALMREARDEIKRLRECDPAPAQSATANQYFTVTGLQTGRIWDCGGGGGQLDEEQCLALIKERARLIYG